MEHLTQSDLKDVILYDPETGIFRWRKKRRGVQTDKNLGTCNGRGYLRITVLGKSYYAHRLAWLYVHGVWPEDQIDHVNGARGDNRICNLRSVTCIENAQNTHGASGVSWHKKAGKWQAHVCAYKKKHYLGLFDSYEDANAAYINSKKEYVNVNLQKAE